MENASKALLIAGAILLVIAIIAVGMGIFGTAKGVVGNAENQIDNMSVQMHNKQFESYSKEILTGYEAKELVTTVIANNSNIDIGEFQVRLYLRNNDGTDILIVDNYFDSFGVGGGIDVNEATIIYANRYNCTVTYDNNGIINNFELRED